MYEKKRRILDQGMLVSGEGGIDAYVIPVKGQGENLKTYDDVRLPNMKIEPGDVLLYKNTPSSGIQVYTCIQQLLEEDQHSDEQDKTEYVEHTEINELLSKFNVAIAVGSYNPENTNPHVKVAIAIKGNTTVNIKHNYNGKHGLKIGDTPIVGVVNKKNMNRNDQIGRFTLRKRNVEKELKQKTKSFFENPAQIQNRNLKQSFLDQRNFWKLLGILEYVHLIGQNTPPYEIFQRMLGETDNNINPARDGDQNNYQRDIAQGLETMLGVILARYTKEDDGVNYNIHESIYDEDNVLIRARNIIVNQTLVNMFSQFLSSANSFGETNKTVGKVTRVALDGVDIQI